MLIYKIFRAHEWQHLDTTGETDGAPIDITDGFIHFSTANQAPVTAAKHFAGWTGLILAAVEADTLGNDLKWEVSRGGERFPHLYRKLDRSEVVWTYELPLGSDGHCFPELPEW